MSMMLGLTILWVSGFVAGWGWRATSKREDRYAGPNLHEGRWAGPSIDGRAGQVRVVWAKVGHVICAGRNHVVKVCTIGPGMAHVDTCHCGAQRYGVYGAWS